MLWRLFLGGVFGGALSACRSQTTTTLAASAPTLDLILDPSKDVVPVRCVVVGGGYTGSKLAYMFDSMFDVTFIDEKNYFELTNDIIPIVANPWDARNEEACRRLFILHRYYLKRTNVLTGTVDGVEEDAVTLRDGRRVPYDLLFVAPGERKPFPFATKQRSIAGRVQELRHFNHFLGTCKKVAVLGGGPVGTSLAMDLAQSRPELQVHLYHAKSELIPALPTTSRKYAREALQRRKNISLHLCTRVTDVDGYDAEGKRVDTRPSSAFARLLGFSRPPAEPTRFTVRYDKLHFEPTPQQSIVSQAYFGRREPKLSGDRVESTGTEEFDYVFSTIGDVPRPIQAGKGRRNILAEHEAPDGHYRVSTLMQLYRHPNIWAPGRCNNLPWVRSYGSSDVQVRTIFRGLNSVVYNPTERFLSSRDGVQPQRMAIPRLLVRLGNNDAVGATPWSGGMVGLSAFHEFMQDRNHLVKEFQQPIFYKQQDPAKVKQRISNWASHETTDIVDFSHS
ncbi:putative apoptosis-inducing factor A-like [Trypanosoma conorhini]|uniref:Putative apoptosis-inducing factor A-like n=1 Tax=Trypanosoma conorhini TaxID=83891 RepID=A0A3R7P090_9TRYP|nr:putative apoptosis-inducing factor A-like [Trypanosoma conorhini]RNF14999.1 putative apoptosis-inducing factor A-like [Trypanosoma conorhini]